MQRFFDVILSGFGIVILIPILIPTILILKLTGEGEIFYIQERIGRDGKIFGLIKFVTMIKNSANIGPGAITVFDDPRVLPFGKYLRKSKINELPQLWNIFNGDMSVVGPRPLIPNVHAFFTPKAKEKLKTVRPGLTGVGSIFFRNEDHYLKGLKEPMEFYRKNISPYKGDLEIWFIENNSLWLYFKLIFVTIWVVVFQRSKIFEIAFKDLPPIPDILRH